MRNTRKTRPLALATLALSFANAAGAHPGHGLDGAASSLLHILTEPVHVAPLALAALGLGLLLRRRRRGARARTR
jgi:hypothetical protein